VSPEGAENRGKGALACKYHFVSLYPRHVFEKRSFFFIDFLPWYTLSLSLEDLFIYLNVKKAMLLFLPHVFEVI
jgi:hypothetical protein